MLLYKSPLSPLFASPESDIVDIADIYIVVICEQTQMERGY